MEEKMIFIVGVGRSGTSLLQSMLNSHSQIAFPPETHFLRNFLSEEKVSGIKAEKTINRIKNDKYLARLNMDLNSLIKDNINENSFNNLAFFQSVLKHYKESKNKKHIGDKDPKNLEFLDVIKKHFPNAYVIHMIRDPRDVVLSRLKAQWSKDRGLLMHSLTYNEQIKLGMNKGPTLFKDRYIEVKYEELIGSPQNTLKNLSNALGLSFEDSMLQYMESSRDLVANDERSWKENVFQPVLKNNSEKWKDEFSRREIEKIELLCSGVMKQNNYKPYIEKKEYSHIYYSSIKSLFKFLYWVKNKKA